MRAFIGLIEDVIRRRPGDLAERLTPWIFLILGGAIVWLMLYSCATAQP